MNLLLCMRCKYLHIHAYAHRRHEFVFISLEDADKHDKYMLSCVSVPITFYQLYIYIFTFMLYAYKNTSVLMCFPQEPFGP